MKIKAWLIDMPTRIRSFSSKNDDDSYDVFVNSNLSLEERKEAYAKELKHIENNDFDMLGTREMA